MLQTCNFTDAWNAASTQDCHSYTDIHGLESWQNRNKDIFKKYVVVFDNASAKYRLQTKLDRQWALIFILQQAMHLCEVLCKNYSWGEAKFLFHVKHISV